MALSLATPPNIQLLGVDGRCHELKDIRLCSTYRQSASQLQSVLFEKFDILVDEIHEDHDLYVRYILAGELDCLDSCRFASLHIGDEEVALPPREQRVAKVVEQ